MMPFDWLSGDGRQVGLIVAVAIGFGFGFVLERAGFGRAPKLAAQFYLTDMTVFKVMFSAIITAMVGLMVASGFGLADLTVVSTSAASYTFVGPMLVGGFLLGVGFIVAGYCPGTSAVSAASGKVDGMLTFGGVIAGTVVFNEVYPSIEGYVNSGNKQHLFLYDLVGLPAPVLAALVVAMALALFMGAEWVERWAQRRATGAEPVAEPRAPRRLAFATVSGLAAVGLVGLALPGAPAAKGTEAPATIGAEELARRVLDTPWAVRVLDLRDREACAERRVPGAECAPVESLGDLGLPYAPGVRDLMIVADGPLEALPADVAAYKGRVFVLDGGWKAWEAYALTAPEAPPSDATAADREAYTFRSGLYAAMTGVKQAAPPPPAAAPAFQPKKKKGGGCS